MLLSAALAASFVAVVSTHRRHLRPMMTFASTAYLLKLWCIDRMTFYYEQHGTKCRMEGAAARLSLLQLKD